MPHLQTGYHTEVVISSARTGFGEAVVEVIDRIIDLAPLPQFARSALQAVTHTWPAPPARSGPSSSVDFSVHPHFDKFFVHTRSKFSIDPIGYLHYRAKNPLYKIPGHTFTESARQRTCRITRSQYEHVLCYRHLLSRRWRKRH